MMMKRQRMWRERERERERERRERREEQRERILYTTRMLDTPKKQRVVYYTEERKDDNLSDNI